MNPQNGKRVKVKPGAPGLVVRDHTDRMRPIPDAGKRVIWDSTWSRRMSDGDIALAKEAPPPPVKSANEKPKAEPAKPDAATPTAKKG